jgi:hypothetical protein
VRDPARAGGQSLALELAVQSGQGKVLSQHNQDHLVNAARAIHAVLGDSGMDLDELFSAVADDGTQMETPPAGSR